RRGVWTSCGRCGRTTSAASTRWWSMRRRCCSQQLWRGAPRSRLGGGPGSWGCAGGWGAPSRGGGGGGAARPPRASGGAGVGSVLVAGEIATSVVLLIGAGLLVRSMQQIQQRPLGFSRDRLLVAELHLPDARYATDAARKAFASQLLAEVRALPGVQSAVMT